MMLIIFLARILLSQIFRVPLYLLPAFVNPIDPHAGKGVADPDRALHPPKHLIITNHNNYNSYG